MGLGVHVDRAVDREDDLSSRHRWVRRWKNRLRVSVSECFGCQNTRKIKM